MQMEMQEDDEEIEFEIFPQDSKLEVIYAPQRICLTTNILSEEVQLAPQSDYSALQLMLDKALSQENYEIAQKLQEILQLTNNSSKVEDK
jgi:PHD/YefM family antitoxin component YafN of YafNO toxin-antitoxin module